MIKTYRNQAGGIVHRAVEDQTSKIVALKRMYYDEEECENGMLLLVLREISILRSIKHPNIIGLLDVATDEDELKQIYMVMEYCELVSLSLVLSTMTDIRLLADAVPLPFGGGRWVIILGSVFLD